MLDSVINAGRRALAEAGVPVQAVALANQGESVLAWDPATGRALTPVIVWQDRRAEPWCRRNAAHRDRVHALTGLELDPYFSAPKMRWLRDTLTTEGVVTTTDTWLVHRLCGAFVTDASTASRSLLLDLDAVDVVDPSCSACSASTASGCRASSPATRWWGRPTCSAPRCR